VLGGAALLTAGGGYWWWTNKQAADAEAAAKLAAAKAAEAEKNRSLLGTKAEAKLIAFATKAISFAGKGAAVTEDAVSVKTNGMIVMGQLSNGSRGIRLVVS
jgi:hypothetical protein